MQRDERCYKKVASFFVDFEYIAHTGCYVYTIVKFLNTIPLSRARVRAQYRSFRFFAITSVTTFSQRASYQDTT